jgi:hypothetical protein
MSNNPPALTNLPPLDSWTNEALVADFAAQCTLDHDAGLLDESDATARLRAEILRRMKR